MNENEPDLSNITDWLSDLRKREAEQSKYASAIIEKHLKSAGLPFKKINETTTWSGVGWDLYLNIDGFLREEKQSEMLKDMFAELIDFCEASTSESFAYKLKILLEKFTRSRIKPFLPPKAVAQFAEIDRMLDDDHERYLEILNQQGY